MPKPITFTDLEVLANLWGAEKFAVYGKENNKMRTSNGKQKSLPKDEPAYSFWIEISNTNNIRMHIFEYFAELGWYGFIYGEESDINDKNLTLFFDPILEDDRESIYMPFEPKEQNNG